MRRSNNRDEDNELFTIRYDKIKHLLRKENKARVSTKTTDSPFSLLRCISPQTLVIFDLLVFLGVHFRGCLGIVG